MKTDYLLDSDVVIDFLRRRQQAVDAITGLKNASSVGLSSLSVIEILGGMREHERKITFTFINGLNIYHIDKEIGILAGEEMCKFRAQGVTLSPIDVAHSALCKFYDLTLITGNVKHYPSKKIRIIPFKR